MFDNFIKFINTYNYSFAIFISIITFLFSIYSFRKNYKFSKSKYIIETILDILTNFISPLKYLLNTNKEISSNKALVDFFINKSYLIDTHIYILVNEILIIENNEIQNKEKLVKSRKLLLKLVENKFIFFKSFCDNELLFLSSKSLVPNNLKPLFTFLNYICSLGILSLIFLIFYLLYELKLDTLQIISILILSNIIFSFYWILFRFIIYPRKNSKFKESKFLKSFNYYSIYSIVPFDGEYYCPICKKKFYSYKGLILECPSKKIKCSFINFIKLIKTT